MKAAERAYDKGLGGTLIVVSHDEEFLKECEIKDSLIL
jgi:hypothetical protein